MDQTAIDLWKEVKQTEFFSSVNSLQEDTEGGMLPYRESKGEILLVKFLQKIKQKVHIASSSHCTLNISRYMA